MPDAVKNLMIGDVLQLQHASPSENQDRYAVKLIGYLPGHSLVITAPGKQARAIQVREGQVFTVRLLQGSNIFGFVAKVLAVFSKPFPHLHLTYPEEVESAVVRNAPRVSTRFQAKAFNISRLEEQRHELVMTILDLSTTGARLLADRPLGRVGERIQLILTLQVCGGEDELQLLGYIRSVRRLESAEGDAGYVHGVQFGNVNRYQQLLLCSFVLGQIAQERG